MLFAWSVPAQNWDVGGMIIDPNGVTSMDLLNWSQITDGVSSARATAMGGALTSLGGDVASMGINPAGLGMYRQNDISLTPTLSVSKSSTADTSPYGKGSMTNFSIANFGVVLKAYEGTGNVVAVNVGFGYSRLADLNYRTSYTRYDNFRSSISGVFARQLSDSGLSSPDIYGSNFDWYRVDPTYWGAALGFKCGLIDDSSGDWAPDMYGVDPYVDQHVTTESKGSIGEYDLSLGMNIANKLYWGMTLGIQNLHQRRDVYYGEEYSYLESDAPGIFGNELYYFNYDQTAIASGTGVNVKIGLTYRPTSALRLGVAFHSPTWYSLDYKYQGAMQSVYREGNAEPQTKYVQTDAWIDSGRNSWNFRTPARLMFGASYTFGTKAVVSVDYERAWYGNIHTQSTPVGQGAFNGFFKEYFKGSNSIRAGVELKPVSFMSLRAGYGYSGSMLKDKETIFSSPVNYETQHVSCGLGFVLSNYFYMDLAYRCTMQKYTDYKLFYAVNDSGEYDYSGDFRTDISRHNILLTLGFRF